MNQNSQDIKPKLDAFKRKYFMSLVIKGVLISLGLILSIFLIINSLEYSFRFGSVVRAGLLGIFIITATYALFRYVIRPLYQLFSADMNDEAAARKIGAFFPEVSDRLLNIIQLQQNTQTTNALYQASINQKVLSVKDFEFSKAVRLADNRRYVKYVIGPVLIILLVLIVSPAFFTTSTERIVKFNEDFVPKAPFNFQIDNNTLQAFKNEDFTLELSLIGEAIPDNVYLFDGNRKIKMKQVGVGDYTFNFIKIQNTKRIKFEAA
ncbi:ATPase, partial [Fulvivirga sp. RKSG066]|nr:ATPase [Fulvivirga aurantia]